MERLDLDLIAQQAGNGVLDVFSYSTYVLDLVNFFLQFLKCNLKQDTELGSKKRNPEILLLSNDGMAFNHPTRISKS